MGATLQVILITKTMAKIIELILTEERRGLGKEDDPVRLVTQLFTKEGELVAEKDGYSGQMFVNLPNLKK